MDLSKVAENNKELAKDIIANARIVGASIAECDLEGLAFNVLIQCYQNGFYVTNEQGEHVIGDVLKTVTIEALESASGSLDSFIIKLDTTQGPWEIDAWRVSCGDYGFLGSVNGIYSES